MVAKCHTRRLLWRLNEIWLRSSIGQEVYERLTGCKMIIEQMTGSEIEAPGSEIGLVWRKLQDSQVRRGRRDDK